jgi:hypothetical protein
LESASANRILLWSAGITKNFDPINTRCIWLVAFDFSFCIGPIVFEIGAALDDELSFWVRRVSAFSIFQLYQKFIYSGCIDGYCVAGIFYFEPGKSRFLLLPARHSLWFYDT